MRLYENPFSPFARKVRMVLEHKRLSFETVDGLAREGRRQLAAVNPRVEVPVPEDDVPVVVDSSDIVAYLGRPRPWGVGFAAGSGRVLRGGIGPRHGGGSRRVRRRAGGRRGPLQPRTAGRSHKSSRAQDAPRQLGARLSLGGYLSLAFHVLHRDRVRALMLFDTGPGYRNAEARKRWNEMAERYARELEERGLEALGAGAEVRVSQHRSPRGLALAARGILAQKDARVIDGLSEIGVPTLVLWGERDEPFRKPGEYMAARIPGARRVVVAGAGHAANLDQPEAFNAAIADFLAAISS